MKQDVETGDTATEGAAIPHGAGAGAHSGRGGLREYHERVWSERERVHREARFERIACAALTGLLAYDANAPRVVERALEVAEEAARRLDARGHTIKPTEVGEDV